MTSSFKEEWSKVADMPHSAPQQSSQATMSSPRGTYSTPGAGAVAGPGILRSERQGQHAPAHSVSPASHVIPTVVRYGRYDGQHPSHSVSRATDSPRGALPMPRDYPSPRTSNGRRFDDLDRPPMLGSLVPSLEEQALREQHEADAAHAYEMQRQARINAMDPSLGYNPQEARIRAMHDNLSRSEQRVSQAAQRALQLEGDWENLSQDIKLHKELHDAREVEVTKAWKDRNEHVKAVAQGTQKHYGQAKTSLVSNLGDIDDANRLMHNILDELMMVGQDMIKMHKATVQQSREMAAAREIAIREERAMFSTDEMERLQQIIDP